MNPQARRGWWVSDHAVDQFVRRIVGAHVPAHEVAEWLRDHAPDAIPTGRRTLRDQQLYRLAHPWSGPDLELVVTTDRDGTRAVLTCWPYREPTPRTSRRWDRLARGGGGPPDMMATPDAPLTREQLRAGSRSRLRGARRCA